MDAFLSDQDLGLSYPTPADDAGGDSMPALTVHRPGWTPAPAPAVDMTPVAQPAAPAPIGAPIPGSAPTPAAAFSAAPAPAAPAPAAGPKLLSDEDLGLAPAKDAGALTNEPDDGYVSGGLKAVGTTAIKGLAHIPGMFGDAMDFGDYLIARGLSRITGRPVEDILKEESDATKKGGWSDPRNFLPSGPDISDPVLAKTGEYRPTSTPGRLAMAAGETALGGLVGGTGAVHLATNALAGGVGQGATDWTQDPLKGAVAGLIAGPLSHGGVIAAKKVAAPAVMGIPVINRLPAVAAARDNAAATRLVGQASDPQAVIQWAQQPVEPSLTPDAPQTTAAAVGTDRGLFQAEKDARNANNVPFNAIDTAQSQAHQAAIGGAQPTGDVFRPGRMIVDQHNAIDQAVERAHDTLAQRFQDEHTAATQAAQDAAAPLRELPTPEQTGETIRAAQQEATNAAKQARDALYKAVDPDGTLATVVTPLKEAKAAIASAIDPHTGVQPSGAEAKLWSDIDRLPDVVPFKSLQTLDSRVTAAMADARRNPSADDPQAISRLTQLKSAVMDAIHNGVENQAAHEARLVELGLLAPENAVRGRLGGFLSSYLERQQPAALAAMPGRADGAGASFGSSSVSRMERARGGAGEGPGDNRGAEGASQADGVGRGQPEITGNLGAEGASFGDRTVSARMHAPETAAVLGQDVPGTVVRPFSGPLDRGTNQPQGIVAYHGTPHDFDRFSSEHIGAGEGNQAYGHGLYFAENEAVAKGYRDTLAAQNSDMRLGGQGLNRSDLAPEHRSVFDHIQDAGGDIDTAIQEARDATSKRLRSGDFDGADYWSRRAADLEDWKAKGFALGGAGHLYQVRLNRDPEHFLDWDTDYADQSQYVKAALAKLGIDHSDFVPKFAEPNPKDMFGLRRQINQSPTGAKIYQDAVSRGTEGLSIAAKSEGRPARDAGATAAFRDAGIAGIRYLDAGSRGAGDGSRNYVTFNDHDIQVTHKNGVPLARPLSLPDYLKGEARGAFVKELADAGMSPASFSTDLKSRADGLLKSGERADHGRALEQAHGGRYAAFRESLPSTGGGVAEDRGGAPGSASRGAGDGLGRGGFGQAGGAPRENLTPNIDQAANDRLTAAKQSHIDYERTYRNPTVKPILADNGFKGQYTLPNGVIPSRAIIAGDRGFETANRFLAAANNDPRAISAMQDAALAPLRKAMPPIGNVHPNALARWKETYSGALRALDAVSPGFSDRFDNAANATQAMLDLGVQQKAAMQDFQARAAAAALERKGSAAGQFAAKVGSSIAPTEVENAVGNMLATGTQGATRMRSLVSSVSNDPEALAGLRKAGVDWMLRAHQNADGSLSGAKFISFVRANRDTLKELYPTSQVSMFGAIADRIEADTRWRTQTAIKGGSDTAKNVKPMLEKAVEDTKQHLSIAGAATAGFLAGGPKGALGGASLFLLNSLRSAGIRGVDDLYHEALTNPETARFLISKMPLTPEGGKLRALAGLLRRNLIVGATQTQQQSAPQ